MTHIPKTKIKRCIKWESFPKNIKRNLPKFRLRFPRKIGKWILLLLSMKKNHLDMSTMVHEKSNTGCADSEILKKTNEEQSLRCKR